MKWRLWEQKQSIGEDNSLYSKEWEDLANRWVERDPSKGKEKKTKTEFNFYFKEPCYKGRPVYEDSYLDSYQDWKN